MKQLHVYVTGVPKSGKSRLVRFFRGSLRKLQKADELGDLKRKRIVFHELTARTK